ncbi:MAG TPA: DNA internalization-related competence protein ComEC/Rec2, partial [Thermoanaerobaculia bacterium]|nr:DNA internalization-related competence protein ComEC/Rec2 [Thermoanaerobaculia bacterium]
RFPSFPAMNLQTKLKSGPLLVPAVAFAAGAWLAFQLTFLPISLLALLLAAGLAWGRRAGAGLAAGAAGLLLAAWTQGLPAHLQRAIDPERPAEVHARVAGHWLRDDQGWQAPARVESIEQASRVLTPALEIGLHLPGEEEPPAFGSLLSLRGYLHRSPGFANRRPVPPGPWRMHLKSRLLLRIEEEPGRIARLSSALRRTVERAYAVAGPESPGKALARALVLGDPHGLPFPWRRGLAAAGLTHLLAVSGLHVALVALLGLLLGGALPRRPRHLLAAAAVVLYLLLVGPHPALLRASLMALLALLAITLERPPSAANSLGCALLVLVLASPELVERPGFALSLAGSAGVVLFSSPLSQRLRKLAKPAGLAGRLGPALAVSLAAELAALPWSLPQLSAWPFLAPLADLAAVPWTVLALVSSLLWTASALVSPRLAAAGLPLLNGLAAPYGWPAAAGPHLWPSLPLLATVPEAAALAAGLLLLLLGGRPYRLASRLAGLALVLTAAWSLAQPFRVRHGVELALFDVGQGDSILLRDGDRAVLVDGGGWDEADFGGRVLLPALLAEGVRHLDAVVLTHPDRDHCGGLVDLAAHLPVDEVWTGPGWPAVGCAGELFALPRVRTRLLPPGSRARVGSWHLTVLHAGNAEGLGKVNERSLVLRAEAAGRSVLLTGDAGREAEWELLDRLPAAALRADLLKVGHHGSASGTSEDFLAAVAPRLALISVGLANPFHHPAPAVLSRLARRGIPLLRTDRSGEVVVHFLPGRPLRLEQPGAPRG